MIDRRHFLRNLLGAAAAGAVAPSVLEQIEMLVVPQRTYIFLGTSSYTPRSIGDLIVEVKEFKPVALSTTGSAPWSYWIFASAENWKTIPTAQEPTP